jgi:hypothetical protein
MNSLVGVRDFKKDRNRQAFAVIEMRYEKGKSLDPTVVIDAWIDMGVYDPSEAKIVASAWEGDTDFQPKIDELAELGGKRKAKKDIEELFDDAGSNMDTEALANKARELAQSWLTGTKKKYMTAQEVEEAVKNQRIGEKLEQGIPLLDNVLYKHAGQHKGTVKATILREKHGKTRHACWETAQDLRQGNKVLYVTLEGTANDIIGNIKQVLQYEWDDHKDNLFLKDGTRSANQIEGAILDAVFNEDIDKVVIDYLHIMNHEDAKYLSENENSNKCCQRMTELAVKHDFNLHILNQARQADKQKTGYGNVPKVYDCYGSNQLIKDASIILVGIRPRNFDELITKTQVPPFKTRVKDPDGNTAPLNSVFIKPILGRKKLECQHQWLHLVDSDNGLQIYNNELI